MDSVVRAASLGRCSPVTHHFPSHYPPSYMYVVDHTLHSMHFAVHTLHTAYCILHTACGSVLSRDRKRSKWPHIVCLLWGVSSTLTSAKDHLLPHLHHCQFMSASYFPRLYKVTQFQIKYYREWVVQLRSYFLPSSVMESTAGI